MLGSRPGERGSHVGGGDPVAQAEAEASAGHLPGRGLTGEDRPIPCRGIWRGPRARPTNRRGGFSGSRPRSREAPMKSPLPSFTVQARPQLKGSTVSSMSWP